MKLTFQKSFPRESDARSFIFQPDESVTWQAGQYTHFALPIENPDDRGDDRWFTISSAPSEGYVMITTRIYNEKVSSFKQALMALKPGFAVEADAPEGDFVVEDTDRNYIFVAGGIGITPIRSILKEADTNGIKLKATVLYANRTEDAVFKTELAELQAKNPDLKIEYVIDPEKLDEERLKRAIDAVENPFVYISGPEPMVEALVKTVAGLGIAEENIRHDDFPGYEGI